MPTQSGRRDEALLERVLLVGPNQAITVGPIQVDKPKALTSRYEAELESVSAKADGQVALARARAEGATELAAARAEEVSRLVSQLAELRATAPASHPNRSRPRHRPTDEWPS